MENSAASVAMTVVVPTRGRVALVQRLLESLRDTERADGIPIEIALYDDSHAEDASRIRDAAQRWGALFIESGPSVRAKRNRGAQDASTDIVLYLDSDTQAHPGLLTAHVDAYTSDAIGGAAGVTSFVGGVGWLWESVARSRFLNAFSFASRMDAVPWATCSNVSYRRDLIVSLGGFDETLPSNYGGDDADFGMRVNEAGYVIKAVPGAVVSHSAETWLTWKGLLDRAIRWGRADFHLWHIRRRNRLRRNLVPQSIRYLTLWILGTILLGAVATPYYVLIWISGLPAIILFTSSAVAAARHGRMAEWSYYLLDDVLGLVFELATVWEGLKFSSFSPLLSMPVRGPLLPLHESARWTGQRVAATAGLFVLGVLLVVSGGGWWAQ